MNEDTNTETISVTIDGGTVVATDEASGKQGTGPTKWEALRDLLEVLRRDEGFGETLSGRLADVDADSVESVRGERTRRESTVGEFDDRLGDRLSGRFADVDVDSVDAVREERERVLKNLEVLEARFRELEETESDELHRLDPEDE
jgi:hypothetical protein